MIALFLCFSISFLKDFNVQLSLSGLHKQNDSFSSIPLIGFHSCHKTKYKFYSDFRDTRVALLFSKLNDTHYVTNHCPQALLYPSDIEHFLPLVKNGYYNLYLNDLSIKTTINASSFNQNASHTYLNTKFLISLTKSGGFTAKPIESVQLDSQNLIIINTTFYLSIDNEFDYSVFKKTKNQNSKSNFAYLSLILFLPSIITCTIWSRELLRVKIPQISKFYNLSMFMPNTLLFSSNGLVFVIQIFLYFFLKRNEPFNYQYFQNLAFIAVLIPTGLHVFELVVFNFLAIEAEIISSSFGTVFFTYIPLTILYLFNRIIFHSFRFLSIFEYFVSMCAFLLVLFIVTRGIGYFMLSILPNSFELPFVNSHNADNSIAVNAESSPKPEIRFPNLISLVVYGLIVTFLFSKISNHILDSVLNETLFDINEVFPIFVSFLSISALYSSIRTYHRTKYESNYSWNEDHLLYNVVAAIFVSIYMFLTAIFSGKIKDFEMLVYIAASIYSVFGLTYTTGAAASFLVAFIQCYFAIIRPRIMK